MVGVGNVRSVIGTVVLAGVLLSPLGSAIVAGQGDARQRAFNLADQLMSPYCPGLLLSSCQSQGAHDLKAEITARLAAGESEDVVVADLARRFGPGIRGAPEMQGIGLVAWLGPGVIGAVGLLVLGAALRTFVRPVKNGEEERAVRSETSPELSARLDEELDALD